MNTNSNNLKINYKKQKTNLTKIFVCIISLLYSNITFSDVEFDPKMLLGNNKAVDINKINNLNYISPGTHEIELYLNRIFINRENIKFIENKEGEIVPCFSDTQVNSLGLLNVLYKDKSGCYIDKDINPNLNTDFDAANFKLSLTIPQVDIKQTPRGSVSLDNLDSGNSMIFANYIANYYKSKVNGGNYNSQFASFDLGINLYTWQFRQLASYSNGSSSSSKFNLIRSYIQKPLVQLKSLLLIGNISTPGSQFSSLSFNGIQLYSDDRMLPSSQRGYAPTIRGVATTTALVIIKQEGNEIYQTTVPPGQFLIDDLYPTSYNGDLFVEIRESNGVISSFTVPFTALPESLRPGRIKYNISAGEVRDIKLVKNHFTDAVIQYGLNNALTLSSGFRFGDRYQSLSIGTVLATNIGAFGFAAALSNAKLNSSNVTGGKYGLNYSKTFSPTNTVITLAGYRYATENYYEYRDVLGLRERYKNNEIWESYSLNQKNQMTLNVNQSLGNYGNVYISGTINSYYGNKKNDSYYQMGYSNSYNNIGYNINYSRQKISRLAYDLNENELFNDKNENVFMVSLSIPLSNREYAPVLGLATTQQNGSSTYQTNMTGILGKNKTASYSINADYDSLERNIGTGLSLSNQFSYATLSGNISNGKNYTQGSVSAQGAIVAHKNGITLGPRISDTFALVEAKGAYGARVANGMGAKIDQFGYAIVPSLMPYQYNNVSLESDGIINNNIELLENSIRVAPYSGASILVKFKTKEGYPVLIRMDNKYSLPLGENVYDDNRVNVGTIGQGNQIYARVSKLTSTLSVGEKNEICSIKYTIPEESKNEMLITLPGNCL